MVRRSHVGKAVDDTKTRESEQELPIHEDLQFVLEKWREAEKPVNGWMFGNIVMDLSQVRAICEAAMREYGVPARIRTDNGAPFAGTGLLALSPALESELL